MAERHLAMLREYESLSKLLAKAPHKLQKGLFTQEYIEWTTVDVDSFFIAIGTNVGIIYLVDRSNGQLQKLQCKTRNVTVTRVRLCHNVDYLVAVGTSGGQLFIFQMPSILPGRKKQLHLYEVLDLHYDVITSLVWSQNSEKLYSGDVMGHVCCTEFNYDHETSKSYRVLTESHEIVQLDYSSRMLLVSTKFRTALYHTLEKKQVQVGTKERKIQGSYGAVFVPGGVYYQPQDMVLFAVRPGLRLWKACSDGTVKTTLIFKDLVTKLQEGIELLDDKTRMRPGTRLEDMQFGPLKMYMDTYLVTFHEGCLFVIDPGLGNFCGYHTGMNTIKDVVVCEDEIFVLSSGPETELRRIAQKPLPGGHPETLVKEEAIPSPLNTVSSTAEKVSQSIVGAFKGMGEKFQDAIIEGQILPGPIKDPPWGSTKSMPSASQSVEEPTSVVVVAKNTNQELESSTFSTDTSKVEEKGVEKEECAQEPVLVTIGNDKPSSSSSSEPVSSSEALDEALTSLDVAPGGPKWCKDIEVLHPGAPPLIAGQDDLMTRPKQFREESLAFASAELTESIVVKPKKKAKKKLKVPTDKDSISVSSNDLQPSSKERSNTPSPLPVTFGPVSSELTDQNQESVENIPRTPVVPVESDVASQSIELNTPLVTFQSQTPDMEKLKKLESELTALPWEEKPRDVMQDEGAESKEQNELVGFYARDTDSNITESDKNLCNKKQDISGNVSSHTNLQSDADEVDKGIGQYTVNQQEPFLHSSGANVSSSHKSNVQDNVLHQNQEDGLNNKGADKHQNLVQQYLDLHLEEKLNSVEEKRHETEEEDLSVQSRLDTSEEIFSIYDTGISGAKSPESSCSSFSQVMGESSIEDVLTYHSPTEKTKEDKLEKASQRTSQKRVGFMDSWTEMLAPANLQCLCVAERILWVVDKSDRVHWSFLSGSSLKWHKLEVSAQQISVAPSGGIVWRLHNGKLYAGTKITTRAPAGLKWVDFVEKNVVSMSVDEHMGWYVKSNGEIVMHKKLTRERPCFKPLSVPCVNHLVMVVCRRNVVWCLTRDRNILVRTGVKDGREEGTEWMYVEGAVLGLLVSSYDLGMDGTAWVVDVVGRLWFTTGVTQDTPQGCGNWWQVPLTAYLMQDVVARQAMKAIAEKPGELARMRKKEELGGLVSARCSGIWLCPGFKNVLHLCCSNLEGYRWDTIYLPKMESSTMKWQHICAEGVTGKNGLIWLQQPNGYIFCFHPGNGSSNSASKVTEVAPPEPGSGRPFVCMSVCESVVWTLTQQGTVWLRTGIRRSCPHGVNWQSLDMQQLAGARLLWLSAGSQNIWAVDSRGQVYLRIGTEAPSAHGLNQAWVPVDGTTDSSDSKFLRIYVGHNDWMVWALDSQDRVYTRKGVTESMPIGTHWVSVPGGYLKQLCVGDHYVYGVNSTGEVLVRDGIKENNPKGTYWHKIPGCVSTLSASRDGDLLWGVDLEGQIVRRCSQHLQIREALPDLVRVSERAEDVEGDWELL